MYKDKFCDLKKQEDFKRPKSSVSSNNKTTQLFSDIGNQAALQMMKNVQDQDAIQKKSVNTTGIPNSLKNSIESSSGLSFDDVKVHYNSNKPKDVGALAYTQGNQVYMGPGQEKHLNHELAHVVQQKQGRVSPTTTINGFKINDDKKLEKEADNMF